MNEPTEKQCSRCGEIKLTREFMRIKQTKRDIARGWTTLRGRCRTCYESANAQSQRRRSATKKLMRVGGKALPIVHGFDYRHYSKLDIIRHAPLSRSWEDISEFVARETAVIDNDINKRMSGV